MMCCICERDTTENLVIMGKNICTNCEESLMEARADEPSYTEWIQKIEKSVFQYSKDT